MTNKFFTIKNMAKIAILAAISFIFMFFEFPLPFIAPPFYKIDFSEVAVIVGAFSMGPLAGVMIEFLKVLLNVLFEGTSTAYVGELSNFVVGCAFVVPAALIYKHKKNKKNAIIGLIVGTLSMTALGFLSNLYVVIPAYVTFMGLSMETIIGMGQAIFPAIDTPFKFVMLCTTPFNIIKGIVISIITVLIYKHISPLLKRF